ncbi:MAG: gliding motility-associated C-terminal domain-containing protein [Sphingobacteriales bacterium]|nr:MAG: gliding motility-associated C-terminal domain-containing protein [Sphingobacteriales bacterium]
MRKSLFSLLFALVAMLGILRPETARASHAAGGELLYRWISGSTYEVLVKFYRDCSGINEPASFNVCYNNTCNTFSGNVTLNKLTGTLPTTFCGGGVPGGGQVITGCPAFPTTCTQAGSPLPGYQEFWYTGTVTLPSTCNFWRFSTFESARNGSVGNIQGGNLYLEATLYSENGTGEAPGNSSPCFTVKPVPYVNNGQPFTYNMGAVDPDGDSLTYQVIQPRTDGPNCTGTNLPFTDPSLNITTRPFFVQASGTGTNGFNLNSQTGQISFATTQSQVANLAILVREYQNGQLRGTSMRDIQIISLPGTSRQPQASAPTTIVGGQSNNGRIEGCSGQPISFCFNIIADNTNAALEVTDNSSTVFPNNPVSPLGYTGAYTDSVRACFTWTPGPLDTGFHNIIIQARDTVCRPPGTPIFQSFSLPIYVYTTTNILKDTSICQGDTVSLQVFGGSKFLWSAIPGGDPRGVASLSCDTCKIVRAWPSKTTSYVVVSNLQSVCGKNRDTVTITVPEAPQFNLGPDRTTCVNSSVILDLNLVPKVGTNYTIRWTPATGLSSDTSRAPVASPKALQTQYVVTVTPGGLNRCAVKDTIIVYTLQGFNIDKRDTAICLGNTVSVPGTGDTRYTYTWTPVSSAISNPNDVTTSITPTTVGPVSYTIKASYPGCPDSLKSFVIDAQPTPVFDLGPDRSLCFGDTANIDANVQPLYSGYTYVWTPGGFLSNSSIPNPVFSAQETTRLKLVVRTSAGCRAEDSVLFTVTPADFITVGGDTTLCPGDSARLRFSGNGVASFSWTPAIHISDPTIANPVVRPITNIRYNVFARDTIGCIDSGSVFIQVKPQAVLLLPDTVYLYPGDSLQFNPQANGSNVLYYNWYPATGLDNPNIANPVARPAYTTEYIAYGTTEFGCKTSDTTYVKVMTESLVQMPNAFAPSNDAASYYKPARLGSMTLKSFRIFNRWGAQVFQTANIEEGWDGKLNGEFQPMGVYVFIIEGLLPSGKTYYQQGSFTLIR